MEEFRLGAVQSGLSILCHMVSLIAVFFSTATGRYTKREVEEGEREEKKKLIWGESRIVLMLLFVVSLQIEPEGSAALFMVSADLGIATKFSTAHTLEGRNLGVDVIRLSEKTQPDSEFTRRQKTAASKQRQQCCSG